MLESNRGKGTHQAEGSRIGNCLGSRRAALPKTHRGILAKSPIRYQLMTQLVIANDIPSNINTVERLAAWCAYVLAFNNPNTVVVETVTRTEKAAQALIFQAADNTYRLLVRQCIPVDPAFMSDKTVKIWMHSQEFINASIPAGYKAN